MDQKRSEIIRNNVLKKLDFSKEISDAQVLDCIDQEIQHMAVTENLFVDEMKQLRKEVFHSIRRLDILQDLVDDPEITEIMINGANTIFVEKKGRIERVPQQFSSEDRLKDVIQQIVSSCNRVINESSPIADARLANGARVNAVLSPVALNGPILTIRRFPDHPITISDLIEFGSISQELAEYLGTLVQAGYNIFISGGTGSGKTTFLNALSSYIPNEERVITIEDNAELQLQHLSNLVRLEVRNANVEGCIPVSIRDLIRTSLRMRPDRIIVGEVRGGEAIDMIQAMNTGHDGSMSTGHANSAKDMIHRLETMVLMGMNIPMPAIRAQISSAIDIIVHLGRLRDRTRKVMEVVEVIHHQDKEMTYDSVYSNSEKLCFNDIGGNYASLQEQTMKEVKLRTLFRFVEQGERDGKITGTWKKEADLERTDKLDLAGIRHL